MNDRDLMQMALDALHWDSLGKGWINPKTSDAMYALRNRLAQPEREWAGLTEQDVHDAFQFTELVKQLSFSRERPEWCENFAAYLETKLKEKNT
jgi:hypothetical protein